uniref:Putative secreted protein n=1 Tax=Lutzomyia longipalpis TaxID=7200 RepID=A0A1B0CQP2_LUTLO
MQLNLIVIFAIVGFIGVPAVSHHQLPFQHLLRSDSEDSFSVYNVTLTTKSGIVKSSFESKVEVLMKMIIRPYKNSTIHVRVEEEKGTATNENIVATVPGNSHILHQTLISMPAPEGRQNPKALQPFKG